MIYFLTTKQHDYTLRATLLSDPTLRSRMTLLSYEKLFRKRSLPVATYVFSDLERLDWETTEKAAIAWNVLQREGSSRLLNQPLRSMRRYELLRTLYRMGINNFDAYRLADAERPGRFPVFIRAENDHTGSLSALLDSEEELDREIERLVSEGTNRDDKLVIEYCNVADERGIYHWHGAHRVGARIYPVFKKFSKQWMAKDPVDQLTTPEFMAEHEDYVRTNPHEAELLKLFDIARIEYGRIDYAFVDGQIRVFEINTNPISLNAAKLDMAIQEIDTAETSAKAIPLRVPRRIDVLTENQKGTHQYLLAKHIIARLGLNNHEPAIMEALKTTKRRGLSLFKRS